MRNEPISFHEPGGLGIFELMARAMAPSPFHPDFRTRWERYDPAEPTAPVKAPAPNRTWMERLERWFWSRRQRELEAYLAQSADVHDLEARIRDLERDPLLHY